MDREPWTVDHGLTQVRSQHQVAATQPDPAVQVPFSATMSAQAPTADLQVPSAVAAGQNPSGLQIDRSFDIAGVSELAHRERSAFKPVYSMNRWWARRSSAVFRAILLGLLDDSPDATAESIYCNGQQRYPQARDQVILDPLMGGGTSVVESLRLGFRSVGVDLNPLAWFIVRNECTAVDLEALDAAYERLRRRVESRIDALYATRCPHCSGTAEIVHAFWAKVGPCRACDEQVEMRRGLVVGRRRSHATLRFHRTECGGCGTRFDAEIDRASLTYGVAESGQGPSATPWNLVDAAGMTSCPECAMRIAVATNGCKPLAKRVELFALQCPSCRHCHTCRGPLPSKATCPGCECRFEPAKTNTDRGYFICSHGHDTSISDAARAAPGPLGFHLYAIEGYCPGCADRRDGDAANVGYRFFKAPDPEDIAVYEEAKRTWGRRKSRLAWPRGAITDYEKTNRLVIHGYSQWSQLFNPRQLLALTTILSGIRAEPEHDLREALTAAFIATLEHHNMLNIYYLPYAQSAGAFGRHDFHPKVNPCEGNPWGGTKGRGTFRLSFDTVRKGKQYLGNPHEPDYRTGRRELIPTGERVIVRHVDGFAELDAGGAALLLNTDSRNLSGIPDGSVDHVVTDPPYADSVQYSELSDFFYVWLREALGDLHPGILGAEETPKAAELVENVARKHSRAEFHEGLTAVFRECHRVLKDSGRLVFTFHHSRRSQWEELHRVILDSGFTLLASYPVASEGTRSGNLVFHTNRGAIAYDIIHVCAKTGQVPAPGATEWPVVKQDIESTVRGAIDSILGNVDHGQRIGAADVAVMVWAEVMSAFSIRQDEMNDGMGGHLTLAAGLDDSATITERVLAHAAEINGDTAARSLPTRSLNGTARSTPTRRTSK